MEDFTDEYMPYLFAAGALVGLLFVEYQYFTRAEQVRLLFVILLAPVGAIAGGLITVLAAGLTMLFGIALAWFIRVAIVAGIVFAVVYGLYNVVIWTN